MLRSFLAKKYTRIQYQINHENFLNYASYRFFSLSLLVTFIAVALLQVAGLLFHEKRASDLDQEKNSLLTIKFAFQEYFTFTLI
ncbi:unnamed protein product [Blepharisma stoltei]|uniref:Gustatory receptor n=1 Tax=Blepharisma stoltei TaxID=1481888 RepID=A0AAU9IKB7_9CILI|nr:unnamed protein product [Blepharisma stoltei]